jgi:threonine dehydrogenase-like Zn-dependent dehydrogenase
VVEAVAKAGTIGIVGVYPAQHESFPSGAVMNRNLAIKAGNCNRRYVPGLLSRIATGGTDPTTIWTQQEDVPSQSRPMRHWTAGSRKDQGHPRGQRLR